MLVSGILYTVHKYTAQKLGSVCNPIYSCARRPSECGHSSMIEIPCMLRAIATNSDLRWHCTVARYFYNLIANSPRPSDVNTAISKAYGNTDESALAVNRNMVLK